jgi:DNA-binding transcriptional ArsR family regulator
MIVLYNIMVNSPGSLDAVFAALSDPTRRRIVERLARGSLTIGQIAAEFPISQPAISRHVRVLEESGVLDRRVEGRVHHCTLAPDAMNGAAGWIGKQTAFWNSALDRLGDVLNEPAPRKKRRT